MSTNNPINTNTLQINKPLRYAVLIGWFFTLFVAVTITCLVTYFKVIKVRLVKNTPVTVSTPSPTPTPSLPINTDVTKLIDEAKTALQNSNIPVALEKTKEIIALDATNAEAYKIQATALVISEKPEEAITSYQKSLELKKDVDAYFEMGKVCEQLGKNEQAISAYTSGLEIKNDFGIRLRLARVFARNNQVEEARKNYTLVVSANDPNVSPTARLELSKLPDNRIAMTKPVKTPSPVLEVKPTPTPIATPTPEPKKVETPKIEPPKPIAIPTPMLSAEDYLKRASDFYNSRDYNSTIREADKGLKVAPNDLRFYYLIGGSYSGLGNLQEALKAYRKCSPPSWNGVYSQQCAGRAKELEKKLNK